MSDSLINLRGRVVIVAGAAGGGIGTQITRLAARTFVQRSNAEGEP